MIKVWGRRNSLNVQKVMWAIGEIGIAHERIDVGHVFGGLDTPEFARNNPNRRIPTIEDDGLFIWESNAIIRYLAARYGGDRWWHEDPRQRAAIDSWMDWMQTTPYPHLITVFWGLVRTPASRRNRAAIDEALEHLGASLQILDRQLANYDYVLGDRLTLADIPVGTMFYRYYDLDIPRPKLPNIERWYRALADRPAYREHVMVSYEDLRAKEE